jgi:hypothetical protein
MREIVLDTETTGARTVGRSSLVTVEGARGTMMHAPSRASSIVAEKTRPKGASAKTPPKDRRRPWGRSFAPSERMS